MDKTDVDDLKTGMEKERCKIQYFQAWLPNPNLAIILIFVKMRTGITLSICIDWHFSFVSCFKQNAKRMPKLLYLK